MGAAKCLFAPAPDGPFGDTQAASWVVVLGYARWSQPGSIADQAPGAVGCPAKRYAALWTHAAQLRRRRAVAIAVVYELEW